MMRIKLSDFIWPILAILVILAVMWGVSVAGERTKLQTRVDTLMGTLDKVANERDGLILEMDTLLEQQVEYSGKVEEVHIKEVKVIEVVNRLTVEETDRGDEIDLMWELYNESVKNISSR